MIPIAIDTIATVTPPLVAPSGFRRFVLRWNSRKVPTAACRLEWQECQGVVFSAHDAQARVALSNGMTFTMMSELEFALRKGGDFTIQYIDQEAA